MGQKRAAIVIGVCKTGGLDPLESPAAGAKKVADWLKQEGFDVKAFIDAPLPQSDSRLPVLPGQIYDAVDAFVSAGKYHQLVVYFSGHGYWKNDTELWLLTKAPADPNAAISWAETAEYAKDCGIPNVVLISDACRSIPDTPQRLRVRGSLIFPNPAPDRPRAKVDKFMACAFGRPAYEAAIGPKGEKESVFTHCLLKAFETPDADMILEIAQGDDKIAVVPNRRLGKYLQREAPAILSGISVKYDQLPDAEVLSDDVAYIGRVRTPVVASPTDKSDEVKTPSIPEIALSLRNVAAAKIGFALDRDVRLTPAQAEEVESLAASSGLDKAIEEAKAATEISHFETETGFVIIGAGVARVIATNGARAVVLAPGNIDVPGLVRIEPPISDDAWTTALQFSNQRGTALAALRGYICHVRIVGNAVASVSYVPSARSLRWPAYEGHRARIEALRATVSGAARLGVFRIDDQQKAQELAEQIRTEKAIDPTLGLFAAYAYSDADQRDEIQSIIYYMYGDLHTDLFDVALLARKLRGPVAPMETVPFCPMLTQGWNLLRAREIKLPKVLDDAQDELERALWTTFKPERTKQILKAIEEGEIR